MFFLNLMSNKSLDRGFQMMIAAAFFLICAFGSLAFYEGHLPIIALFATLAAAFFCLGLMIMLASVLASFAFMLGALAKHITAKNRAAHAARIAAAS